MIFATRVGALKMHAQEPDLSHVCGALWPLAKPAEHCRELIQLFALFKNVLGDSWKSRRARPGPRLDELLRRRGAPLKRSISCGGPTLCERAALAAPGRVW